MGVILVPTHYILMFEHFFGPFFMSLSDKGGL